MSNKLADVIDLQAFKNKKLGFKPFRLGKLGFDAKNPSLRGLEIPPTYVVTDTHYVFGTVIKTVPKKEETK